MLDPASPVPLYRQLADELAARIRAGEYAVGSRVPSEPELSERYRLGRPTVRQATELLVRRGMLARRRGSGTFVTESHQVDLFTLSGTLAAFERTGLTLESRLLLKPRLSRPPDDADRTFSGERAYHFARLGSLGDKPVLLEEFWLARAVFPGLERLPLSRAPLSRLVEERYGLRPVGGRQVLRVTATPERWAQELELEPGRALLLVLRWLDFAGAPAALFARMYCRTDQVDLTQDLSPDGAR